MLVSSEAETKKIAVDMAAKLLPGSTIALYGELGAGKTTFIQGLAKSLGIEKRVLSPTFVFVRSYVLTETEAKIFHHVDLYRAETLADAKSVGIEEILEDKNAIIAIEWPEKIETLLPADTIRVRFEKIAENKREITIS